MKKQFLRKSFSLTLVCLILLTLLSGTVTATGEPAVTFDCNFNGIADGTFFSQNTRTIFGWNSFNDNDLGIVASDEESGAFVNIHRAGYRNFNAAAETLTEGKVYLGFSYKYELPEGYTDGTNLRIYVQSEAGAGCTKIIPGQNTEVPEEQRVAVCDANNFFIGNIGQAVYIFNSRTGASVGTVGSALQDGNWHEIGYLFDLTEKTLQVSVDGQLSDAYPFPSTYVGTIGTIGFNSSESKYYGSLDNFIVKHVPSANVMDARTEKDEENKTIDIFFDEPISAVTRQALNASAVSMKLCGSDTGVTISGTEKKKGALRLTYSGSLEQGREYFISFPKNQTSIFGTALPDGVFINADSIQTVNQLVTCDFENETEWEQWAPSIYPPQRVSMPPGTTGNSSSYVLAPDEDKWSMRFGDNTTIAPNNLLYMTVLEMDYLSSQGFYVFYASDRGTSLTGTSNKWKHLKLEVNYAANEMRLYIDDELKSIKNSSDPAFPNLAAANYQQIWFGGANLTNAGLYIDNFTQKYIEESPTVKSVRYVDTNGKQNGLDFITPSTSAIEINFSEKMDEGTLSEISLSADCVTGTDYDAANFKYTLNCDSLLTQNTVYTLTIPNTVTSAAGVALDEITYSFETGIGEFELKNLSLNKEGSAIVNLDGLAGTANVTISADKINTEGRTGTVTLIYCLYDDDALVDVNYDTVNLSTGGGTLTSKPFTIKAGIEPDLGKVFAWHGSIANLQPILPAKSY